MSSDLIEHFRLDAQIYDDHTLHIEYVSEPARGMRKARVEKRWYKEKHIGHGAFGDVWLEVQRQHEKAIATRAVKSIQKGRMETVKIDYKRELLALAKLSRYPELFVTLHGWYENNHSVFLAMEYFPHGDLEAYITRGITEDGAKIICAQLLDGLSAMHSIGFTHRDLKPKNIFIVSTEPQWWVKIGDFGISKRINSEQTALRTQAGTQQFQAPEILGYVEEAEETSEYTNAVDIWSLGCVTYLMLTQTIPFARLRALNEYCSGRTQFPSEKLRERGVSMDGHHFIEELLNPHPSLRIVAEAALQHAWLELSLPVEDASDGVHKHEHETEDVTSPSQSRSTDASSRADLRVGTPEQQQLQSPLESGRGLEHEASDADTSALSLHSLQTTLPGALQQQQAFDLPTEISKAPLPTQADGLEALYEVRSADAEPFADPSAPSLSMDRESATLSSLSTAAHANRVSDSFKSSTYTDLELAPELGPRRPTATRSQEPFSFDPVPEDLNAELLLAAEYGTTRDLDRLLQLGANIDSRSESGSSALHLAASAGQSDNVRWLLEGGAIKLTRDRENNTALHLASEKGHLSTVRLLGVDSDVDLRGSNGNTPLHMASSRGHLGAVGFLLAQNADVSARNDSEQTPLHLAAAGGSIDVVKLLLDAGAEPNALDSTSATAQYLASRFHNPSVVDFLSSRTPPLLTSTSINPRDSPSNGKLSFSNPGKRLIKRSNIGSSTIPQDHKEIRFTIIAAKGLHTPMFGGVPDLFAYLRVDGGQLWTTAVAKRPGIPYWNEVFDLKVTIDSVITVQIHDKKKLVKQDMGLLGRVDFWVRDVIDLSPGADTGEITLALRKKSSNDFLANSGKLVFRVTTNVAPPIR